MSDPLSAALIVGTVAAQFGKANAQANAAESRQAALETQSKELMLQSQQKTLANYDTMEKVLDAQIAHMTTTGAAFSSPSYNAIQRNTMNIAAKKQKNIDIESSIQQENIEREKRNVRNTLFSQLFGDVADTVGMGFNIYKSMPTMKE